MSEVTIIGIDLAKRVFQLHGARHNGSEKLSWGQLLAFIAQHVSLRDGTWLGSRIREAGA